MRVAQVNESAHLNSMGNLRPSTDRLHTRPPSRLGVQLVYSDLKCWQHWLTSLRLFCFSLQNEFHVCSHCFRSDDGEFVIGPLTADNDLSSTKDQQLSDVNLTIPVPPEQPSGPFIYRFQLWTRLATVLVTNMLLLNHFLSFQMQFSAEIMWHCFVALWYVIVLK